MSVKSTLFQGLFSTSTASSTVSRVFHILIVGGVVLAGFSPTRAAAQIFDPQSGEITVPACAQERPQGSAAPAASTPAVATPAVATPASAPTSASSSVSSAKNQGIPAVMMILEEERRGSPHKGGETEEQEVHARKNGRSGHGEEKSEDAAAAGDASFWNSTLLPIVAIIAGVLLGLVLNFFAVVWLIRTCGARLVPQIKVEVVNAAGGGNYAQGGSYPGFASNPWPMQSSMSMMSPSAESPRIKDPLQSEQAVLKELFQQNRDLQQQLGSFEPEPELETQELETLQEQKQPSETEPKPETEAALEPVVEPLPTEETAA